MEKLGSRKYFLVDNGSLSSESVLSLRLTASKLEEKSGFPIIPAGIMHSHKIDSAKLNGVAACSMDSFFASKDTDKIDYISVIPMFLGPSLAITDWLPKKLGKWRESATNRNFAIADCLFRKGDQRLGDAVIENIRHLISQKFTEKPFVILVDHGTPLPEVNLVREEIGKYLAQRLGGLISGFSTACMERRKGVKYDFNDPLLENLLADIKSSGHRCVVVGQLFLAPGRHAGPDGDIAQICKPFERSGMHIESTFTLGNHPLVLEILADRLRELE